MTAETTNIQTEKIERSHDLQSSQGGTTVEFFDCQEKLVFKKR